MSSSRINTGGPAHPIEGGQMQARQEGKSLRAWFAGQALAGLLASEGETLTPPKAAAIRAYAYADAMIEIERATEQHNAEVDREKRF